MTHSARGRIGPRPARSTSNGCGRAAWRVCTAGAMKLVVDASVMIDLINGRVPAARALIYDARERGDELWSSYVIRTEVLAGMRPGEEHRTHDLLRVVHWAPIDRAESDAAE